MDKLKIQIIFLSGILICLVSLVVFSIIQMFIIDILSGIIGVAVAIVLNIILFYLLFRKPKPIKFLDEMD